MKTIFDEAVAAAEKKFAETPEVLYCGFAWVTIRPARGEFVKWLKQNNIGRPGTYGGWEISSYQACPSTRFTQSMNMKEEAVDAFVHVLLEHGINASANSRAD